MGVRGGGWVLGKKPQKGPQEDRVARQPPAEPGAQSEFTVKASEWGEQGKGLPGSGGGRPGSAGCCGSWSGCCKVVGRLLFGRQGGWVHLGRSEGLGTRVKESVRSISEC